jgi:Winged helix DNA-binding domain
MKRAQLVQQRICNQRLFYSEFQQPVEVVRWLGGVQAQDFNGAKWELALRMVDATHETIAEAFNRGEILRTHALRPTWHFVAPEDIRWLLELTAPRVNVRCGPNYRKYELDDATFKRSNKILTKALQGGKHLTRAELKAALNRSGVAADDIVRLAHILIRAELDGVVCSGPRRGKQFTYALLEERVAPTKRLPRDEALARLTRTYFQSHGPATLNDFIWWSGLTTADARTGIALVKADLEEVIVDGNAYWRRRSSQTNPGLNRSASRPDACFLPAYDEYNVAYKNRDALPNVAILSPTIMLNGEIVGNWKHTNTRNSVTITATTTRPLKRPEQLALVRAANKYAAYLGVPVRVDI